MNLPITSEADLMKIAHNIYEKIKYEATEEDIISLSNNIKLLNERGLSKLNHRLIDGGKKIWDTFAEHNFASSILPIIGPRLLIDYEPTEDLQRPPDFKINKNDITFWIQIKNLACLERENRQNKIIQEIERQIKKIQVGKFLECSLNNNFAEDDIELLVSFIRNFAEEAEMGVTFFFPDESTSKARLEFWKPHKSHLSHLSLGSTGDLNAVNLTGLAQEQIKNSVVNAAGAFNWASDERTINLIAIDSDRHDDIDICNALFGTAYEGKFPGGGHWCRHHDGIFEKSPYHETIFGVITLRKANKWTPISPYKMSFFANKTFEDHLDNLTSLLPFEEIIHYNMRPPMGSANFNKP